MVILVHPTKLRSERISILSSPEPSWSGFALVKSPTWCSRLGRIKQPCIPVADAPCLEQQPFWQWCKSSFPSYLRGELLLASSIRFPSLGSPTGSGPWSARNLCQPLFSSASPHLRLLTTFSRPGSIDHQRTPRATLVNTLSGNFITICNLSSVNLNETSH